MNAEEYDRRKERKIMVKVLCSTGAIIGRPNGRDFHLLKNLAGQLDCDGFEFMMYDTWYDRIGEIISFFKESGISTPVYHTEKSIGELISKGGEENIAEAFRLFGINAEMAVAMGAEKLVLHLWGGMASDGQIENNYSAYKELRRIADENGTDLLIENVVCNVSDPMTHLNELYRRYPDIHFTYDTKMAAFHGQLEGLYDPDSAWLWKEDHIAHYHVNDYAGGYKDWSNLKTLPIGSGNIDFERFFKFVRQTGYDGTFTVESTAFDATGAVDLDMINRETEYIRKHM